MTWLLFILMAAMTAGIVLCLTWRSRDRFFPALLTATIPALALLVYLMLGRPDLPAQPAAARDDLAPRHLALLMKKPMEALWRDPDDLGALAAMGALTERLQSYDKAAAFYSRAAKVARDNKDPREALYEKDLKRVSEKLPTDSGAKPGRP